jgi:hypothetical protein
MKRSLCSLVITILSLGFLTASARALTVTVRPRVFVGTISFDADLDSWSGSLTASNPTCILTVPNNGLAGAEDGFGPNGSLLLSGSTECPGKYELFLSNGNPSQSVPTTGGIPSRNDFGTVTGHNTGVYGGTFAIVRTTDFGKQGRTVSWAGTYTQVWNIDPAGNLFSACGSLNFCANLGDAFGDVEGGLWYLLELNGFTWNVH